MRVFLDANILFSGALEGSRMYALLDLIFKNGDCLTNGYAAEEARRNLALKYPRAMARLDKILKKCSLVSGLSAHVPVKLDEKDLPILAGAIAGRATHLLTGDAGDFGALFGKTVHGVKIVSPQLLAQEFVALGLLKEKKLRG